MNYSDKLTSPEIFRRWAAISAISGALERKVWVRTMGSELYPNMYVILVAPPGIGKSEVTWRVRDFWQGLEGQFVASSSVTKAALMDELNEAARRIVTNHNMNPVVSFNSIKLAVNELGVLIPSYENEFMNILTDLWDCKDYSETRRSRKHDPINIKATQLCMLAAATPSYMNNLIPEGAWDQGFISRTILVYSGERQVRSLFLDSTVDAELQEGLERDLARIGNLFGEMRWTESTANLIDNFHLTGGEPMPQHPRLLSYNIRRTVHLIKLSMVMSISESDSLLIEDRHFQRAFDIMTETELYMPEIFKAMAQVGTGKTMEEAWYYLFTTFSKEQKPVLKHRLIQFLQERVPVHNIETTIKMMEEGQMIERKLTTGGTAYEPKGKRGNNAF